MLILLHDTLEKIVWPRLQPELLEWCADVYDNNNAQECTRTMQIIIMQNNVQHQKLSCLSKLVVSSNPRSEPKTAKKSFFLCNITVDHDTS